MILPPRLPPPVLQPGPPRLAAVELLATALAGLHPGSFGLETLLERIEARP